MPGGTGSPARVRAPRFTALPPTRARASASISANSTTSEFGKGRRTPGCELTGFAEALAQQHVLVAARMVIHDRDDLKAMRGVERRGVAGQSDEQNLLTALPASRFFRCPTQYCLHREC